MVHGLFFLFFGQSNKYLCPFIGLLHDLHFGLFRSPLSPELSVDVASPVTNLSKKGTMSKYYVCEYDSKQHVICNNSLYG